MLPLRLSTVITEMNIHQIVNSVFTSNTYILSVEGKDGHVLIDIGDIAPIKQCVQEKCGTVQALFLTHTHYDHIYGIKDLLRLYPDCIVYTSSFGKEALGSDKLNFSRYHNDPVIWMGDNVTVLHENDRQCFKNCHTPKPTCTLAGTLCQRQVDGEPSGPGR